MKTIILNSHLGDFDEGGLWIYSVNIETSMKNNPNFPNAVDLVKLLGVNNAALDAAVHQSPPKKETLKACVAKVKQTLKAIKAHVELYCDGDAVKALSSGFDLATSRKGAPRTFNVTQSVLSGTVDLECSYAGSRVAYIWEVTPDPLSSANWQQFKVTTSTITELNGLTPGNKYWFRVKAVVRDVDQAYSDPLMLHVV